MSRSRPLLVLLTALVLSVYFAVPAEDVPETAYDESESLPYASTAVFSMAVPAAVVPAPVGRPLGPLPRLDSLRRLGTQRLDHRAASPYPICGSLAILDHALRC
jgi:hypothetical protein